MWIIPINHPLSKKEKMELKALVKFNDGLAMAFDDKITLKYNKIGSLIYGTDGLFYKCYFYDAPSGRFQAFAGRKFDLHLESGEVVNCHGQWWDGGYQELSKLLNIEIVSVTASDIDSLKECYVYCGYHADKGKINEILSKHDGPVFAYYDYEKLIKYDDLRNEYFWYKMKSERAKKKLIANVKLFYSKLKKSPKRLRINSIIQ